jgi:hypothetical protein
MPEISKVAYDTNLPVSEMPFNGINCRKIVAGWVSGQRCGRWIFKDKIADAFGTNNPNTILREMVSRVSVMILQKVRLGVQNCTPNEAPIYISTALDSFTCLK